MKASKIKPAPLKSVRRWADKSGNGRHLTQTDTTNQPSFVAEKQRQEKRLNIGFKYRTILVYWVLISRIISLLYNLVMLLLTLFCIPYMMFSQRHYDCWIEMLRRQLDDEMEDTI